MLEAGIGQTEVIQAMIQRGAGDRDADIAHVGEVRQSHATRLMGLAEDHFLFLAISCPPGSNPTFKRPANARNQFRVTPQQLLIDGHSSKSWRRLQHRHDLLIKEAFQWVWPAAAARFTLL